MSSERKALANALRLASVLLVAYSLFTVAVDWGDLLVRSKLTTGKAVDLLLNIRSAHDPNYQRLYVLATYPLTCLLAAAILMAATPASRLARRPISRVQVALVAIVCALVLLTLPAHAPFLLPHTAAVRGDGLLSTQAEYSRAFRDAITYVWSSALLLVIPVVGSARIEQRTKVTTAGLAVCAVLSAYLPHLSHQGSRTDNELIIFVFVVVALLYQSSRIQRSIKSERESRELAERALRAAQAERTRNEDQSRAAIDEFRAIQQRLEAREERRTAFLASAAHDLRQPLLSSMLYADLLALAIKESSSSVDESEALRHMQTLKSEIKSLAVAFDAILDYTQIDSGKLSVNLKEHRLRDIFNELERRFAPQAVEQKLTIRFLPPPDNCIVQTDKNLAIRLLSNLLSNAIKFTASHREVRARKGQHDVTVRMRRRGLLATVYVIDQGCGIPEDMHESIFEAGIQLANPHRDRREGFGLGLATVKGIVGRAMPDHTVRLASIVGRGTHVMVDIPVSFAELEDSQEVADPSAGQGPVTLEGAMVAVVEDDPRQRTALVQILLRAGAFVIEAGSQSEAVECINATDRFPDVILTDYRLPGDASGRTVIEAIRACCGGREVPALILTADHQAALDATRDMAGVEVIRKPIDRRALLRRVSAGFASEPSPLDDNYQPQASSLNTTPARAIS